MHCWNCKKKTDENAESPLPFRAECPHCSADLHCCKQCAYFSPGKPNDCLVPGTDLISDREKRNLCEEFKGIDRQNIPQGPSKEDIIKKLFGE